MKGYHCILALILVIIAVIPFLGYGSSLYSHTYRVVPDNLPWYFLIVFGDNRPSDTSSIKLPSVYYRIIDEVRVVKPFAIIGTGDHTGRGTREQIDEFINSLKGLENVWVCLGNHDLYSGELDYWIERVAPEFYYVDEIPGWRIAFINVEAEPLDRFNNEAKDLFKDVKDRKVILVIHHPLYPDVKHNIIELRDGVKRMNTLLQLINKYNVSLVLQGHWHGYAETTVNNTKYIITGGAGAPLYWSPMNVDAERVAKGKYHYLILILYPNGTYTYTPVDIATGEIDVIAVNETTYLINNTKTDLWGNPVEVPVRLNITINKQLHYIVLMAKPNTTTLVSYKWSNNTPILVTNTDKFYIYIPTNDPEKAIVYTIENTTLIKIHSIPKEIKQQLRGNKTTTTIHTPTTEYKTATTTLSRKTTIQTKTITASTSPESTAQKQTIKTSATKESSKTTTTPSTVKTSIPQNIYEQYVLVIIITVILLTTVLILYHIKRSKH